MYGAHQWCAGCAHVAMLVAAGGVEQRAIVQKQGHGLHVPGGDCAVKWSPARGAGGCVDAPARKMHSEWKRWRRFVPAWCRYTLVIYRPLLCIFVGWKSSQEFPDYKMAAVQTCAVKISETSGVDTRLVFL